MIKAKANYFDKRQDSFQPMRLLITNWYDHLKLVGTEQMQEMQEQ
jgi:hypothetical protein